MTELTTEQKNQIWRGLMRYCSRAGGWNLPPKTELMAMITAADSKIETDKLSGGATTANLTAYDTALAATSNITAVSKELKIFVLDLVAQARIDPDVIKQKLGEVD